MPYPQPIIYPFDSVVSSDCGASINVLSQLQGEVAVKRVGEFDTIQITDHTPIGDSQGTSPPHVRRLEVGSLFRFILPDLFHLPEISFLSSRSTVLGSSQIHYDP